MFSPSLPSLPSRYEHRRLLGEGGMGAVHLVFDREREMELALKTFQPADEGADREEGRFLFKQEFWAMASFRHPNLVAAYDYGELEDGTPYFTMELVPGTDLPVGQDEAAVRRWLPGVAAALGYLHGRGYVHGDLKPDNIRLKEDGTPKVMDLGLLSRSGRVGGAIRGSLLYLAPEAIRQGAIDARTDLYALGAVIYHVLAGAPPFEGDTPMALLRAHLDRAPAPLGGDHREARNERRVPAVSRELEGAVLRLLAKEPAGRYASAAELLTALGLTAEGVAEVALFGSPVIGREELQVMLKERQSGVLWLTGGVGSGKSRLLTEARAELQLANATPLAIAGQGADAPPYQAVKPWLKAIAGARQDEPTPTWERLAPVLARLLPELEVEPAPALEGAQERVRLHAAVSELATERFPNAVWLVDDADQLDAASSELMQFMQRQGEARTAETGTRLGWRWVLTGASAPESATARHLEPLNEIQVFDLARALLGQKDLPAPVVERLPVLSGGMPGTVEALLSHWLRTGALYRSQGAWAAGEASAFELPGGLHVVLDARFQELSEDARRIGRTAAVLGASGELRWLAGLVEMPEVRFFAALAELEEAGVLVQEEQAFRFVRPAQADALAATWDEGDRRSLHGAAARWLEHRVGLAPDDAAVPLADALAIAGHHLQGDAPRTGLPWMVAAVRRSLALYAVGQSEKLLRAALLLPDLTAAERQDALGLLAQVLRFQGGIDEALAIYETDLLPLAREADAPDLTSHMVTFGILQQLKGKYPKALAAFVEAINRSDARQEAHHGVRARLYAGRVAYFAGETGAAKTHLASAVRRAEEQRLPTLLAGGLSLYGYVLASTEPGRAAEGLAMLERAVTINQEIGDLVETQEAYNLQGNVYMHEGRLADAEKAFAGSLEVCQRMGSANETIFAHLNLGAVKFERGDMEAAEVHARAAAEMAQRQGRKFPLSFSVALEGLIAAYRGDLTGGPERFERGLSLAREIQNKYLELNVLVYVVEGLVYLGRLPAAAEALAAARELARATENDEHNGKLDRLEVAIAVLTRAADAPSRAAALVASAREKGQPAPLAHALRWEAEVLLAAGEAQAAVDRLAEAHKAAFAAGLVALLAEIEELFGRSRQALGDTAAASHHFAAAFDHARRSGYLAVEIASQAGWGATDPVQRLHRQEAPRRLGALVAGLSADDRQAFLARPDRLGIQQQAAAGEGAVSADRLHHLTDLIAMISTQPDLPTVMEQALAALVDIAGADRGFLLLYQGLEVTQQVFHGMREDDSDEFSSSLAYQVLWTGEPLFIEDVQSNAQLAMQRSIQALSLRSVLGVPLFNGEEVIGVMLADSQRINTRFRPEDMELALALARQVAITITNTQRLERYKNGFDELSLLHRLALATIGVNDIAGVVMAVAVEAGELAGAERIFLLQGESLACRAAFDSLGRPLPRDSRDLSHSVSKWVYDTGEPLHLFDAQSEEGFTSKSVMALGLRTVFAVPITYGDVRLGVLYMDNQRVVDSNPAVLHTLTKMGEMVGAFLARQPEEEDGEG